MRLDALRNVMALVAAACAGVAIVPGWAAACTPPSCSAGVLVPESGTVPASLPALEWIDRSAGETTVTAVRTEAGGDLPVSVTLELGLVRFLEPLVPGASYVVTAGLQCAEGWTLTAESRITIAPSAPLPTTLGSLDVADGGTGPVPAVTYIGSCSIEIDAARAEVTLVPSESAMPWTDALLYETWVDGVRWRPSGSLGGALGPPSGSWVGRGVDRIYTACGDTTHAEPEGLAAGAHTVEMRARVAGTTTEITTPGVSFDLACGRPASCSVRPGSRHDRPPWGAGLPAVVALIAYRRRRSR